MIEHESEDHHLRSFISGLLIGSLVSAVAILLVAPQSGEKTRAKILSKSKELQEQAVEIVEGAVAQANAKAHQITADVRDRADELQQRGQEVLDEQKERLSAVFESGNVAVQSFLE